MASKTAEFAVTNGSEPYSSAAIPRPKSEISSLQERRQELSTALDDLHTGKSELQGTARHAHQSLSEQNSKVHRIEREIYDVETQIRNTGDLLDVSKNIVIPQEPPNRDSQLQAQLSRETLKPIGALVENLEKKDQLNDELNELAKMHVPSAVIRSGHIRKGLARLAGRREELADRIANEQLFAEGSTIEAREALREGAEKAMPKSVKELGHLEVRKATLTEHLKAAKERRDRFVEPERIASSAARAEIAEVKAQLSGVEYGLAAAINARKAREVVRPAVYSDEQAENLGLLIMREAEPPMARTETRQPEVTTRPQEPTAPQPRTVTVQSEMPAYLQSYDRPVTAKDLNNWVYREDKRSQFTGLGFGSTIVGKSLLGAKRDFGIDIAMENGLILERNGAENLELFRKIMQFERAKVVETDQGLINALNPKTSTPAAMHSADHKVWLNWGSTKQAKQELAELELNEIVPAHHTEKMSLLAQGAVPEYLHAHTKYFIEVTADRLRLRDTSMPLPAGREAPASPSASRGTAASATENLVRTGPVVATASMTTMGDGDAGAAPHEILISELEEEQRRRRAAGVTARGEVAQATA